jgi:hypothetical protein
VSEVHGRSAEGDVVTCRPHCQRRAGHKGDCLVDMSPEDLDAWLEAWDEGHIERGAAMRARVRGAS